MQRPRKPEEASARLRRSPSAKPPASGENAVVGQLDDVLDAAVAARASDVHLEPTPDGLRVRFRVDGVLTDSSVLEPRFTGALVTRVKVLAGLDVAERRLPQDGRFTHSPDGSEMDVRVATLPTATGEGAVLRLLDRNSVAPDLSRLGLSDSDLTTLREFIGRSYGTLLVTGPTGSGKSTTLYSALSALNSPQRKIVTIEDPVEYRLPGTTQIQVNNRAGLTFASGLRSVLRADPDVMMIGEIRDTETARTATEAALTGHLVLATLHTNDAPSAPTRLTDMGVEPYLSASSVGLVVAQRLARRLCPDCKSPSESVPHGLDHPLPDDARLFSAVGCASCLGTGYRGRIGIYEMMPVTDGISSLIVARAPAREIGAAAEAAGMTRLRTDGLVKAALGLTSVEEVLRTTV